MVELCGGLALDEVADLHRFAAELNHVEATERRDGVNSVPELHVGIAMVLVRFWIARYRDLDHIAAKDEELEEFDLVDGLVQVGHHQCALRALLLFQKFLRGENPAFGFGLEERILEGEPLRVQGAHHGVAATQPQQPG